MTDKPHLTIESLSTIKNVFDFIASPNQTSAFSFNTPQNDDKNASLDDIITKNI